MDMDFQQDWHMRVELADLCATEREQSNKVCKKCERKKQECTRDCDERQCDDDYYQSFIADPKFAKVIRDLPAAVQLSLESRPAQSDFGALRRLNDDVMNLILDLLDFQSLGRLSQTSLTARAMVKALPAYKDTMTHVPETITALFKTGLIKYHAAGDIRRMLRTDACVSCDNHTGRYLFLPTCERVCFHCLIFNRVTSVVFAKKWFHLTDRELNTLPIVYSIPEVYDMTRRRRVFRLVSVPQVKQLAIDVHGPQVMMALKPQVAQPSVFDKRDTLNAWLAMSFFDQPMTWGASVEEDHAATETYRFYRRKYVQGEYNPGMAAVLFPTWSAAKNAPDSLPRQCRCKN
jgi:hypothetical protein